MALVLICRTDSGEEIRVDSDSYKGAFTIGRDESANLVIDDRQLSRVHCACQFRATDVLIQDRKSSNGVWMNGRRLSEDTAAIRYDDIVRIGGTELQCMDEDDYDLLGKSVGGFHIEQVIGGGSFGKVYQAMQLNLKRPVALKVLRGSLAKDPKIRHDFLEEARHAAQLNHPNLVQIHDVREVEGHQLLAMELAEGGSLKEQLIEEGALPWETMVQVLIHISRALAYAAEQGLVHRDVKPANILETGEGLYKLADLGIAVRVDGEGKVVQHGMAGTPYYIAPEQARGAAIDYRADFYALGASAWYLLTGSPLYDGNQREIITQHLSAKIPSLRASVPMVPIALAQLIEQMLAKKPEDRPQLAAEIEERARASLTASGLVRAGARKRRRRRGSAARSRRSSSRVRRRAR